MSYIRISNDSFHDKDYYATFAKQKKYNFFNIGSTVSTLIPFYEELLREVLGSKVDETFQDYALINEETQQIRAVFERELDKKAEEYKPTRKPPHKDIIYKGKTYALDLRLTSPIDRRMNDYFNIIQICKECLEENKPMYISIE